MWCAHLACNCARVRSMLAAGNKKIRDGEKDSPASWREFIHPSDCCQTDLHALRDNKQNNNNRNKRELRRARLRQTHALYDSLVERRGRGRRSPGCRGGGPRATLKRRQHHAFALCSTHAVCILVKRYMH